MFRMWMFVGVFMVSSCGVGTFGKASLPILVIPHEHMLKVDRIALEIAIHYWETRLGPNAISTEIVEGLGLVVPVMYAELAEPNLGVTRLNIAENKCIISAAIYLDQEALRGEGDVYVAAWIIAHEIGHVMGLDHTDAVSLMYEFPMPWNFALSAEQGTFLDELYETRECEDN